MRQKLANEKVSLMHYGIREIVDVAQKLKELDGSYNFVMENIGDPIAKSWEVPKFLKDLIHEEVDKAGDKVFGYTHSRGKVETRQWVVDYAKRFSPSSTLDYEYVLFTSGLGAAISAFYPMLPEGMRIMQPTPSYPTHASAEAFHGGSMSIFYNLDPDNDWQPDLGHMEEQIKAHPEVVGILVINPNNPTGAVYSKETLEAIVQLAEKYGLMLISDEVYFRMVYNGYEYAQLTEVAQGRVPLVVMRGLSKDVPWPGGRCGWMEFHNVDLDPDFKAFVEGVKKRVLMEVCSVSLPQFVLPGIYDHPEYEGWLASNNAELEQNGNAIAEVLGATKGLKVNRTNGAFYMMPLFEEGVLNDKQTLPIANDDARAFLEKAVERAGGGGPMPLDQRFAYYVLASTGICIVPASGFFSPHAGFRLTTLDRDPVRRKDTYSRLAAAVEEYLGSA
ncbi:MAG TPA: pyridoxal phosphate-dependent aminotransferase [Candidatus Gracilibacteria bacterium]|nr:pyridoxal phosphate-dependent aminotransferase [Candidatus Gracilibacteria bacterium]